MSILSPSIVKHKLALLNLAEELGNISKACKLFGVFRGTFYRYQQAQAEGGVEALLDKNRRKPNLKNRVEEHIEQAVVDFATSQPAFGQVRVSNELRKQGIFISPTGISSVWLRHNLACFKERLKALEEKVPKEHIILTDVQIAALERKKDNEMFVGEIETAQPGYLGARYFLCRLDKRCWSNLPTNLRGYIF